jgi:hypothetical protein
MWSSSRFAYRPLWVDAEVIGDRNQVNDVALLCDACRLVDSHWRFEETFSLFSLEDGYTMFLQNVGIYI